MTWFPHTPSGWNSQSYTSSKNATLARERGMESEDPRTRLVASGFIGKLGVGKP